MRVAFLPTVMVGALHPAEGLSQRLAGGQAHERTVHREQAMALPALHQGGVLRARHRGEHRLVEFGEGAGAQLGPGVSQRAAAQARSGGAAGQLA